MLSLNSINNHAAAIKLEMQSRDLESESQKSASVIDKIDVLLLNERKRSTECLLEIENDVDAIENLVTKTPVDNLTQRQQKRLKKLFEKVKKEINGIRSYLGSDSSNQVASSTGMATAEVMKTNETNESCLPPYPLKIENGSVSKGNLFPQSAEAIPMEIVKLLLNDQLSPSECAKMMGINRVWHSLIGNAPEIYEKKILLCSCITMAKKIAMRLINDGDLFIDRDSILLLFSRHEAIYDIDAAKKTAETIKGRLQKWDALIEIAKVEALQNSDQCAKTLAQLKRHAEAFEFSNTKVYHLLEVAKVEALQNRALAAETIIRAKQIAATEKAPIEKERSLLRIAEVEAQLSHAQAKHITKEIKIAPNTQHDFSKAKNLAQTKVNELDRAIAFLEIAKLLV